MNILVTGGSGFLGKHIVDYYHNKYNVLYPTSKEVDFSSLKQVNAYLDSVKVDVVIHTAIKGGKRGDSENLYDFICNLKMYQNLKLNQHRYKKIINFCSGAAYDRARDLCDTSEVDIFSSNPEDYYGLAKNLIAKDMVAQNNKFINLRLFGCFGIYENSNRFIKNNLVRSMNNQPIEIHQNKWMDFFWVGDLLQVIDHVLMEDFVEPFDCNMCYKDKYSLFDIANIIKDLTCNPHSVIVHKQGMSNSYIGSSNRIDKLKLNMNGLEYGIHHFFSNLKGN